MKHYIFVLHSMSGIGGGQRYALSKARWLEDEGWQVAICHVGNGDVVLDISGIRLIDMPELRAHPRCIGKSRSSKLFANIVPDWQNGDEVYVESSAPYLGLWGEAIAEHFHGRHLCFVLEEDPNPEDIRFLRFKDSRHELAFINEAIAAKTLSLPKDAKCTGKVLIAYQPSPIEKIHYEVPLWEGDYVIGFVSRLDKSYLMAAIGEIVDFCRDYPGITLQLVFIGDSPEEAYKSKILSACQSVDNLRLAFVGAMSPIPLCLVDSFDLCVNKAAAAEATSQVGIPTVSYLLEDDIPSGFAIWRISDGTPCFEEDIRGGDSLLSLLRYVLIDGGLEEVKQMTTPCEEAEMLDYGEHFLFIPDNNSYEYYDCWNASVSWERALSSCWVKLFHSAGYDKILSALRSKGGR